MNRPTCLGTALLFCIATAAAAPAPVDGLSWLQGCWSVKGSEGGTVEQWTSAAGGTMLGLSRTVKGGKTAEFEFIQLRETEPGKLAYIAQPSGRAPTAFALLTSTASEFVFENLQNNFPQRIIYRREGPAAIHARIEGLIRGKSKAIDFPMTRVSCD